MANEEIREQNVERVLAAAYRCFLNCGIEQTTKECVAAESGLSVRSVMRYFSRKPELVVHTAGWLGRYIYKLDGERIEALCRSEKSGIDMMEQMLRDVQRIYLNQPQLFALKHEFEVYIYRHNIPRDDAYSVMRKNFDPQKVVQLICEKGYRDGSMRRFMEPEQESKYCCSGMFCFLQHLSLLRELSWRDRRIQLDAYINRSLQLYRSVSI